MKKILLNTLACFFALLTFAQETIEVKEKEARGPGSSVYTVLKSNKKVKHGPYKKMGYQDKVMETGFYKNGVKDSTWEEINPYSGKVMIKGNYTNDAKTGTWDYYTWGGELEQQYDHSSKQLVYFKPHKADSLYMVYNGNELTPSTLDQPPVLVEGSSIIRETMNKNLRYPQEGIDKKIQGTVMISFDIDVNGSTSNFKVAKSADPVLDKEALRVVQLIPPVWIAGVKNGQKVKVQYQHPVYFRLE